jgi:hypothetical protein
LHSPQWRGDTKQSLGYGSWHPVSRLFDFLTHDSGVIFEQYLRYMSCPLWRWLVEFYFPYPNLLYPGFLKFTAHQSGTYCSVISVWLGSHCIHVDPSVAVTQHAYLSKGKGQRSN